MSENQEHFRYILLFYYKKACISQRKNLLCL